MQQRFFECAKSIAGAALVGLGIFIFLDRTASHHSQGAPGVLPSLIPAAMRVLQAYAADHQRFLQVFVLHTVASSWPLLLVMVGTVLSRDCSTDNVNAVVNALRRGQVNLTSKGEITMRVMVMVKANKDSEAGVMPKQKLLEEMGKFNEELVKAGVLLAAEGLQPTSKGTRVRFSGAKRTVIDGPFTESKELIAGFWLWQVRSMEEAVEWVKRCPNPFEGESEIEIRQVFEADDFGSELTPELRKREEHMREQVVEKK